MSCVNTIDRNRFTNLEEFCRAILAAISEGNISVVVADSDVLFAAISPETTKEMLAVRVANRLAEQPDLLTDLQSRIETEEPEEWD